MKIHIIITIALVLLFSGVAWAQITNIPDPNFEQELITQGIDSDGIINGQVLTTDIVGVTFLSISNAQISDLTGIEAFASLQSLYCNNNLLTTLDISNNPNLTFLNCENNQLTNLDLSNAPLLDYLRCNANQLTDLDVSNNPELEWLKFAYNQITYLDVTNNNKLFYIEANDNHLSQILLGQLDSLFYLDSGAFRGLHCTNNPAYLVICGYIPNTIPLTWEKDPDATYSYGGCFPKRLEGQVAIDANNNCLVDTSEQAFPNVLIQIHNSTDTFMVYSDQNGYYSIGLDTGTYTVEATANLLWQACPNPQTFTVDTNTIQSVDFAMQAIIGCPLLTTDISAPFLRMTGGGSSYTVSYCNQGTVPAYNAHIEVDIDPGLNVLGTSLPIASQNGNIYTFILDTLDVWECGSFTIDVLVDTTAMLGQAHCSEAHIYPDTVCGITWLGPDFILNADCTIDSAYFELMNVGGAMGGQLNYYVFEGDLMIYQDPFQIGPGGVINVTIPITQGRTYRFSTEPIPNYPPQLGDGFVSRALENCNPIPGSIITTSYVLTQYNGNSAPSVAIDCQQNVFAYDPNDKNAQPEGYGTEHYIEANTPLDYKIRFQNTGNDTAFTVVIKDTLSPYLDLSTLQMGVSSHAYTWNLNGNVLTITYNNIMLPDSNINEPASNGFVTYTINQVANIPIETRIENTAYIYFDFNPAIVTNTTFHTIGEDFFEIQLIETTVSETGTVAISYNLFPNPTQDKVFIQTESDLEFEVQLYNLSGQLLGTYGFNQTQDGISLKNYPSGTYILKLQNSTQTNIYKVIKN